MSTAKRLVCLANSRKLAGRCIAGREWGGAKLAGPGKWIRPVSARPGREVSEYERQYEDGSDPRVLDIIDVPIVRPLAEQWQTENHLLDPEAYWRRVGRFDPLELATLADAEQPLWHGGFHTYNGKNDRIPVPALADVRDSLRLIDVPQLELAVFAPGEAFGNRKRRVQGRFRHAGQDYALWLTDPVWERPYLAKLDGSYPLGRCFLTISLGEEYQGHCYKLIAAVLEYP